MDRLPARTAALAPAPETARAGLPALAQRLAWPVALAALGAWGLVLAARGRGLDFAIYLRAARRFVEAEPIYRASDGPWVFKYAPPVALLFAPFTLVPPRWAVALWNAGLVAGLAALRPLLASLLAPAPGEPRAALSPAVLAVSLAVLGQSLFLELFYGQVNVAMLLLLACSAAAASRGRSVASGAAWALAVALKPTAILFALPLFTRRPRVVAYGIAAGVALWIPVLLRYGFGGTVALAVAWRDTLTRTTLPWVLGSNTQGLPTVLLLATGRTPTGAYLLWAQLAALALCAAALGLARRSGPHLFAGACFAAAFASPHAWRANFVLALPMVALALTDRSRLRAVGATLVALAAVVELTGADAVVGRGRIDALLLARPFALAFGALFLWTLASARLAPKGAPSRAQA